MSKHKITILADGRILIQDDVPVWWEHDALRQGLDRNTWRRKSITINEVHDLIGFEPVKLKLYNEKGELVEGWFQVTREDSTSTTFMCAQGSYTLHPYGKWVADVCEPLLKAGEQDGLIIQSVGTLEDGAYAWMSLALPEAVKTKAGMDILPSLLAGSSLNQSMKTRVGNTCVVGVCDNTVSAGYLSSLVISEVKHTSGSLDRYTDHAMAVAQFLGYADTAKAWIDALADVTVTDNQIEAFLLALVPKAEEGKSDTLRQNKRDGIRSLLRNDIRCAPWRGSALGAFQAANTWDNHYAKTNGDRAANLQLKRVLGKTTDAEIIAAMEKCFQAEPTTSILVRTGDEGFSPVRPEQGESSQLLPDTYGTQLALDVVPGDLATV